MSDKLELKENEVNEILESYETEIIERTNNVHNQLSVDIKKAEEKYLQMESRCADLVLCNQN